MKYLSCGFLLQIAFCTILLANESISAPVNIVKEVTISLQANNHWLTEAKSVTEDPKGSKEIISFLEVSGTVISSEDGQPLPGVVVLEKGTSNGTVTDFEGNFKIEVENPDAVLEFSFIGYQSMEVQVAGQTNLEVTLIEDQTQLDEVVVVGYGTQRVRDVTGSLSSVSAENIDDIIATDPSEMLKGTVSGITVVESNRPGEPADIRIRGLGTINNNDPLWIVDGVPGSRVPPNNIETITILKDASAQAIYGARASSGVILVTTKSGRRGQKLQVNLSVKGGISKNVNSYDLLNTREFGELEWLMARNAGIDNYSHSLYGSGSEPDIPEYILPARGTNVDHSLYDNLMTHEDGDDTFLITLANPEGTDWMDEITRNAKFEQYSLNISGGSENTTYAFMADVIKEEGILEHTGFEQYNLRSNVTSHLTDWLEIGEKIGVTFSERSGNQSDNSEGSPISFTYRMQPIVPVRDIMGNFSGTRAPSTGNARSPAFMLWSDQYDQFQNINATGNFYAKATIIEDLTFTSLFGFNYNAHNNRNLTFVEKAFAERGQYDALAESSIFGLQWNWSNTFEYNTTFGDMHDLTIMGGTEAVNNRTRSRGASREDFFTRNPLYMQLDAGAINQSNYGNLTEWALFSMFGRINYSLADKYLLGATFRRDGSSRFSEDNRFGNFAAFSAAWRVSEENFMDFSENWLNDFKIRGSWGQTGNDQIGNYNSFTTYVLDDSGAFYPITGDNTTATKGFRKSTIGSSDVKWEITTTTNFGFDATLFNNFYFSLDVWNRQTDDMLYQKRIPDVISGNASIASVNVGNMSNKGIDFELGYFMDALNNDLQLNVSFNLSHYQNEVENLSGENNEFIEGGSARGLSYTRAESGRAFPEFYGYIVDGIFQTEEEANAHSPAFGEQGTYNEPGNFKYRDVNEDGVINADDRTYIGSPHPDFTAGLNLNLEYKGFSLLTRFYASYGNENVNLVRRYLDFHIFQGNRSKRRLYESWGSPHLENNADATMPKALFSDAGSQEPSTYFVEDASYLRLQNLQVGYNLGNLFPEIKIGNLKVYAQVTNLFTLTGYTGLDPEIQAAGMNAGIDRGAWPTPRRFLLGVNFGL